MAKFRFRLEQVLAYRKQLEEQAMQALAAAVRDRDATLARIAILQKESARQRELLSRADTLSGAERWCVQNYQTALHTEHKQEQGLLAVQETGIDLARTALVEKAKARALLDTLKEKQSQRHNRQERALEQRVYDETATLRYAPVTL